MGICDSFEISNNRLRYADGMRFCRKCSKILKTIQIICKCCKNRTSGKSRQCH
jgi:hypothetical protein